MIREVSKLEEEAMYYGITCHANAGQMYDTHPYKHHLKMVWSYANTFLHLVPEDLQSIVLSACWVHDVIEDARQTYNDVKNELGEQVAEIAFALTTEKGRTRKERANNKYYEGIRNTPGATFVKLCDRIANVTYSKSKNSSMFPKYVQENEEFCKKLYTPELNEMIEYLNNLCKDNNEN